ncbi:MAG: DUF3365 domain-containing protein [bacterium]|jgi:hypothetical protein|nr:DUF3365 domain-containing protein [bacterium]
MNKCISIRLVYFLNLSFGLIALFSCLLFIGWVNFEMKNQALDQAQTDARIILDHNMAIHTYFTCILKPRLFAWSEPFRDQEYFEPSWMSSTYAVREIDNFFQQFNPLHYYYKECAINARSEANEADAYEAEFIKALNQSPDLIEKTDIRILDEVPFFVSLRRGETMEETCLRCHDTPDRAPQGMIDIYGPTRSFHRSEGEILSAISIRVPLQEAYSEVNHYTFRLSVVAIIAIAILFLCQFFLNRWLIFTPLATLRQKSQEITNNPSSIGQQIQLPVGKELFDLTTTFNQMSTALHRQIAEQESIIAQRTKSLSALNHELTAEIDSRHQIEAQQEKLIKELREALAHVKQLSGLLPICSSCKKIRDDAGYWQQIEVYIRDHSNAEFTHSLCEECARRYFPDYIPPESTK